MNDALGSSESNDLKSNTHLDPWHSRNRDAGTWKMVVNRSQIENKDSLHQRAAINSMIEELAMVTSRQSY